MSLFNPSLLLPPAAYAISDADRGRYDKTFRTLCSSDGGANDMDDSCDGPITITPAKVASVLSKSGLDGDTLKKIWTLADADRYCDVAPIIVCCTAVLHLLGQNPPFFIASADVFFSQ